MSCVVFLRAVNVGPNVCRTAELAKELRKFDVVNIGAAGTFVVRENVNESTLRTQIAKRLSFKCEIMIVPAHDVLELASNDPFVRQPSGPDITRFVSVTHKRPRELPPLPLAMPSDEAWLLKVIAVHDRFILGVYRRQMKAITYLGKIEKLFGVAATARNWNTIAKVVKLLGCRNSSA